MVLESNIWAGSDCMMISRTTSLQVLTSLDGGFLSADASEAEACCTNCTSLRKRSRSHNQMTAMEPPARLSLLDVKPVLPSTSLDECKKPQDFDQTGQRRSRFGRKSENQEPAVEEEGKTDDDSQDNQCEEDQNGVVNHQEAEEQRHELEQEQEQQIDLLDVDSSVLDHEHPFDGEEGTTTRNSTTSCLTMTQRICEEILQTEKTYVKDLRDLIKLYYQPLRHYAVKHEIELGAMSSLCSSSEIILGIHEELLRLLSFLEDPAARSDESNDPFGHIPGSLGSVTIVSEAFVATVEYMKVYSVYCTWFLQAREELAQLQKRGSAIESFSKMLCQVALKTQDIDIASNMIKPAQRICHYPLLFRKLLKNATSPEETLLLQQTLSRVENVSTQVNEKVRQMQNNNRLMEIFRNTHECYGVELLSPARKLLQETTAFVRNVDAPHLLKFPFRRNSACMTTTTSPEPRPSMTGNTSLEATGRPGKTRSRRKSGEKLSLILLSDVLVMAKKKDQRFKVKRQLCLCCAVIHVNATSSEDESGDCEQDVVFQLEAFKVGRCHCHQMVPSVSKKRTKNTRSRVTSRSSCPFPRGKFKARRWLSAREFSFASARRYVITCDSKGSKELFLTALQDAVAEASQVMFPLANKNLGSALEIPTRIWKTITNDLSSVFLQSSNANDCDSL